jgi:cytochrome bd-type quinol oxidase subunit 2
MAPEFFWEARLKKTMLRLLAFVALETLVLGLAMAFLVAAICLFATHDSLREMLKGIVQFPAVAMILCFPAILLGALGNAAAARKWTGRAFLLASLACAVGTAGAIFFYLVHISHPDMTFPEKLKECFRVYMDWDGLLLPTIATEIAWVLLARKFLGKKTKA